VVDDRVEAIAPFQLGPSTRAVATNTLRTVFVLCELEELEVREAATLEDIPVGTAAPGCDGRAKGILGHREAGPCVRDSRTRSAMSAMDHGDSDFERALLRSASGDAPLAGACERAWSRLCAAMAVAPRPGRCHWAVRRRWGASRSDGSLGAASKATWWLLGAITGSAVTWARRR
jgi:hypothetical protein